MKKTINTQQKKIDILTKKLPRGLHITRQDKEITEVWVGETFYRCPDIHAFIHAVQTVEHNRRKGDTKWQEKI